MNTKMHLPLSRCGERRHHVAVIGPTQRYGYVARGEDAAPAEELAYIKQVREEFYGMLDMAVPVSQENFGVYGVSTTPTLVLIGRDGKVVLYHPGAMTYAELQPLVAAMAGTPGML